MYSIDGQSKRWNDIYQAKSGALPWSEIPFSADAEHYLNSINKKEMLLLPGCGTGETVAQLYKRGFYKIIGTDISEEAIRLAKTRFPELNFQVVPTEDLKNHQKLLECHTFDWLNFHQISPDATIPYLFSIAEISKTICINWIYSEGEDKIQSYVHEGEIYFHKPEMVSDFLKSKGFILKEQSKFTFTSTEKDNPTAHDAITQIYSKS